MAIETATIHTITCDQCDKPIRFPEHEKFVRMGAYGLALHVECFTTMTAAEMLELMGEDETCVHTLLDEKGRIGENAVRLRRPTELEKNGRIRRGGGTELVQWRV